MLARLVLTAVSTSASISMLALSCGSRVGALPPAAPPVAFAASAPPPAVEAIAAPPAAPWAQDLSPLKVSCANTGDGAVVRLYGSDGSVDPAALDAFSRVAADSNGYAPLSARLVQLAFKAAHHFHASQLVVVSAYRQKRRGKADHHTAGEALDFRLPGVDYRKLAAYLDGFPLAGVGIYTNSKTQYVHLDVRDRSYHWLDASPPGVTWREALLADPSQAARDGSYTPESDLPIEGHE